MSDPVRKSATLQPSLAIFLLVNVAAVLICLGTELGCYLAGLPETYFNPFFVGLRFFDFDCFQQRFHLLHSAAFYSLQTQNHFNLLAPAIPIYAVFYATGPGSSLNIFLAFSLIVFLGIAALFARALYRRGYPLSASIGYVSSAICCAFPFWFCFQRANIEIILFAFVAAGLTAFVTGRGYLAAACFGIAGSVKILPIIYLGLFLRRRQYKQIAFGIFFAAAITLAALAWAGPTIPVAWAGIQTGLSAHRREFILASIPSGIGFDHTLLGIYRRFLPIDQDFVTILRFYSPTVALLGIILFFTRIIKLPFLNQFLGLCTAVMCLPPVGFDYTLLYLYCAIGLLLIAGPTSAMRPHLILLAITVSPLSEFILHGVRFGGQIRAVLLGLLFLLSLIKPLTSRFDNSANRLSSSPELEPPELF